VRDLHELDGCRLRGREIRELYGWEGDATCGVFNVRSPIDGAPMAVVASGEGGWDHVSVSRKNRCPNWLEMAHVAKLFFEPEETAMQLHVPASDHVNNHPYCLHWWRPTQGEIPRPPSTFVGIGSKPLTSREDAKTVHAQAMTQWKARA
jgi:hypothetical protein